MKLPLIYYGNQILRKKCQLVSEINEEIKSLVENMIDTMEANNGIGIAAPQVGSNLRIFITKIPLYNEDKEVSPGELKVFINPEILEYSREESILSEGCLSIPKVHGNVSRPYKIKVKALNLEGKEFTEELEGLDSHCVLHENDHINGVLFIDRMDKKERKLIENDLRILKKKYSNS